MVDYSKEFAPVRLRALSERPYFAVALCALVPCERRGLGTFAVDEYARLYWDPEAIARWGVERSAWVLIHELQHWIREHMRRSVPYRDQAVDDEDRRRIATLINLCQDGEINDDLVAEGAKLPPLEDTRTGKPLTDIPGVPRGGIQPQHFGCEPGKLWEEYYEELRKRFESGGGGQPGSGGLPAPKGWDCGSGAHGDRREWEETAPADGTPPGVRGAEADLIRREVARQIQADAAQRPGSVPLGDLRWAEQYLRPPVVPWEQELAALVKQALTMARGCVDYSYLKPSRRGAFNGVLMPALVRPLPDAAVVIDTSGSMFEEALRAAVSEVEGILKACGQRAIPVVCCDAASYAPQRVSRALQVQLVGGGGTDMGVGIAAAAKLGANVLIVLTDGWTPWIAEPPRGVQIVVGIIGTPESRAAAQQAYPVPSWARRVLSIPVQDEDGR